MTLQAAAPADALTARARLSLGSSNEAIYRMVADALRAHGVTGGRVVDVGCGGAALWRHLAGPFDRYCGLDAVRYDSFPTDAEFHQVDLDAEHWPIDAATADVVTAVETIEHLENPWAFVRALARVAKPGGWVVVTTPNQLSVLSVMTLLLKRRFSAFQDTHYPAHRTALLESDLRRIAEAAGLGQVDVAYTGRGRLPLAAWHYPAAVSRLWPRACSDNLMIMGRTPRA